MDATGQIFHISKFSDTLSFFIIPYVAAKFDENRSLHTFIWALWHKNGQSSQRQRKNHTLKWKNRKLCWEPRQRIDRQLPKLRFKATVNMNVSRPVTCMSSRKPRFEIYVWQILFWRDSFVQDLDASVELRHHQSLSLKIFFLFLTEWYSLFPVRACFSVSLFLTGDFLLLLIFPWANIFP